MKTLLSVLACMLVTLVTPQVGSAQTLPVGKFLMTSASVKGEMLMELTPEGVLMAISVEGDEMGFPYANLRKKSENTINVAFASFFEEMSGEYIIKYDKNGGFELFRENKRMSFKPFRADITRNKTIKIEGKWKSQTDGVERVLQFEYPDIVHIAYTENGITGSADSFWFVNENGKDVTITVASIFFYDFAGVLKKIEIKDNVLHFDYNGTHYAMQKVE